MNIKRAVTVAAFSIVGAVIAFEVIPGMCREIQWRAQGKPLRVEETTKPRPDPRIWKADGTLTEAGTNFFTPLTTNRNALPILAR